VDTRCRTSEVRRAFVAMVMRNFVRFSAVTGAKVVMFHVHDSGGTVLSPMATVRLSSPLGTAATKRFLVNEILPGNSLGYSLRFSGLTTYGHLRVEVSVVGKGAKASKASTVWTVPWALLVRARPPSCGVDTRPLAAKAGCPSPAGGNTDR
jgi:hypothetical protein